MRLRWIIGIDEVGRGALAGPVTVGVFALRVGEKKLFKGAHPPLRDSKQLTHLQREEWVRYLAEQKKNGADIWYITHSMTPKQVDHLNVAQAANWAATHAVTKLIKTAKLNPRESKVILDGGLHLKAEFKPPFRSVETFIKGDEKFPAIMLASIVAKVTRDRKLVALHAKHPHYGFARHKGYGTKAHVTAIKIHGIIAVHRLTFTSKWVNLDGIWHEQVITQKQK